MSKYEFFLSSLVDNTYLLSHDLIDKLQDKFEVKPDNARKIIQRAVATGILSSSKPLTFGKGQYLYGGPKAGFNLQVIKMFSERNRNPIFRLLSILEQQQVISFYEGLKITSSPEEKTSSKVSLLIDMILDLEALKILVTRKDPEGNTFILKYISEIDEHGEYDCLMKAHMESMKRDTIFIPDLIRWLKDFNLLGTAVNYRNMNTPAYGVKHNDLFWDAYGYTKTTGINESRAADSNTVEKQTLVTLDIVLSRKYMQVDLDGYLARLQIHINSVTNDVKRKVLPIVIYYDIDDITLGRLRKLGFISLNIKNIYGKNITEILEQLSRLKLDSLNGNITESINNILDKIDNAGHNEQLRTLRGVLFEALMRPVITHFYPNSEVFQGKIMKNTKTGSIREFDLVIISSHPKEIVLIELKGYTGKSFIGLGDSKDKDTLRYFFRGSIPVAQSVFKENNIFSDHPIKACYITTGYYHPNTNDFRDYTSKGSLKSKKIDMFYNGDDLLKMLDDNDFTHESKIIKEYFITKL